MSHIVRRKTVCVNPAILAAACKRYGTTAPVQGTHKLFGGQTATGNAVQLKGWQYPVVFDEKGNVNLDNYGGAWGQESELTAFQNAYNNEAIRAKARAMGHTVQESVVTVDGQPVVKLTVTVGQ